MSVYAQEYGYFFNSNNSDRTYNADSFERWMKPFFVSGVFTGCLQVKAQTTPDMSVQVTKGYANLDGKPAYWPDDNTLAIATASGVYDRIDTVVLRRDNVNRRISIEVVTGTASASPQPTAPTRTDDVFELVLAEVLVGVGVTTIVGSAITDKRPDTDVCGYVVAAVQTPDFSDLYEQFSAQAEEFMGEQAEDFLAWFDEMKDQLSEDAAGHLQLEVDALDAAKADEETVAIVQSGNTATRAIAAGQYVIWKGTACQATTDIASGTTLATTGTGANLTVCSDGIGNSLSEQKVNNNEMGFILNGNKTAASSGIAIGQYVFLRNSTISGCTDGLYTAAKAIPYDTVIDSTYLTAVSGGGLNALNASLKISEIINTTLAISSNTYETKTVSFTKNYTSPPTVIGQVMGAFVPQREVGGIVVTEVTNNTFKFRGYNNYSERLTISYTFIVIPETP